MDSIEDMFLKLLVRGMNPSGHFGAFKGLLFYSQIIFSQKTRKPQHQAGFKMQACHVSHQHGQPGPGHPPQGGRAAQADLSPHTTHCHSPCPLLPAELHKQAHELPMAMASTDQRQSWPARIHFSPADVSQSIYQVLASPHTAPMDTAPTDTALCWEGEILSFFPSSVVSYQQCRNEDTGLHWSALWSTAWHWRFQRRWSALKSQLGALKSVAVLPLPS